MKYEASIDIEADAQEVWKVLTDVELWPEWTWSVARAKRLSNEPLGPGSTVLLKQPRLKETAWTITTFEAPFGFTWQDSHRGLVIVGSHRLEPRADGTTSVTLTVEQRGALAPVVRLFSARLIRRYLDLERRGLKDRVERIARPPYQPRIVVAAGQ